MARDHRGNEIGDNHITTSRSKKNSGPTCIDCGDPATHYFENENYHNPGEGEYRCASCESFFD